MNQRPIPIHLTKDEARLCRDAAKAEGGKLFLQDGEQSRTYSDLIELRDWLDCHAAGLVLAGEGFEAATPYGNLADRFRKLAEANRPAAVEEDVEPGLAPVQGSLF